jgi:hypothetical protein
MLMSVDVAAAAVAVAAQYVVVETVADIVAAVERVLTPPKQFLLVKKSVAAVI